MAESIVARKSFGLALEIIEICRTLADDREYVLSRQLLKSGTSIGANVEEALGAQSRRDFLAKMYVALKEARETRYWLRLLRDSKIDVDGIEPILVQVDEIVTILSSITKTTRHGPRHRNGISHALREEADPVKD